jgi:hypothetical protein
VVDFSAIASDYSSGRVLAYSTFTEEKGWFIGKNSDTEIDSVFVRRWPLNDLFSQTTPKKLKLAHIPSTDGLTNFSNSSGQPSNGQVHFLAYDVGSDLVITPPEGEPPPGGGGGDN